MKKTKAYEEYQKLRDRLAYIRTLFPIDEKEEDQILDKMDVAWDDMSQEERDLLNSEPARI